MVENPLAPIVQGWRNKIQKAMAVKKTKFQDDADEAMAFFNGPYGFLYGIKERAADGGFTYTGADDDLPKPTFAMTVNKVAEMVQIFGPVLYHRNPTRQVNPRQLPMVPIELFGDPNDPNVQAMYVPMLQQVQQARGVDKARAVLLEHYLNYTPNALDLKTHARWAIDEAIIKGMGLLWTELYTPPGSATKMVGSFFDSVDNLVIDPDMESLDEAKWIARKRCQPVWEVEEKFQLPPGTLRGSTESFAQQGYVQAAGTDGDYRRKQGVTNDLVVYWEIYSKMGLGGKLSGVDAGLREELQMYGDFCYLAVCEECQYPLNIPAAVIESGADQQIFEQVQWPTPFWADGGWPFSPILFHPVPKEVWPMSHLKPGLGELKFINWAYSFLAGKVKNTCRDFLAVRKSATEELKETLLHGDDLTIVEIEAAHGTIKEIVEFLQHPEMNGDIFKVIEAVTTNFEKRVGLTELMYGYSSSQLRSAREAQVKADQLSVRPDDMANQVENAMSETARKEALAIRWHLTAQDVAPVMGQAGTQWWQQLIIPSDPNEILHQLEYRIEAGSARKPNKERDSANMQQAMQTLFTPLYEYATMSGNVGPVNALIAAWAKSIDLDAEKFLIAPPPPPPAPAGPGAKPQPSAQPQKA